MSEIERPEHVNNLYHALRVPRRRYVIDVVAETTDEHMSVSDLSEEVGALEEGIPVGTVSRSKYKSIYASLLQTHLPLLAGLDVIEYNDDRNTVSRGLRLEQTATLLESSRSLLSESTR